MDRLFSPWRYEYISSDTKASSGDPGASDPSCVFCAIRDFDGPDADRYVLRRAEFNFVVLNIYPYTSGHLMIVPYEHTPDLDAAAKEITDELMDLTKRCHTALREVYRPDGINLGMNLGRAAGAGVAGHIHMHALPRWFGDANFMTTVGETRVIPEDLATTYRRLYSFFS